MPWSFTQSSNDFPLTTFRPLLNYNFLRNTFLTSQPLFKTHFSLLPYPNFFMTFSSVQPLSHVWLFVTPWTAACQASLSVTNAQRLLKLMSIKSVMPSNQLILSSPSLPAFNLSQHQGLSNESVLCTRWPNYWSFSFSISPSNEYSGLDYMDRIVNLVDASQNKTHQNFSFKQKNMFYFYC